METTTDRQPWLGPAEEGGYYDVRDGKGGAYMGYIQYVARGRWYWMTKRGADGFAASKDAAKMVVFNRMCESSIT